MASRLRGAQVTRHEGLRLITGPAQHVAEIALPGLSRVELVRSPDAPQP